MTESTRLAFRGPRIHETAVVHPGANLGDGTVVGPYCIVGDEVTLGPRCELVSHVRIDGPLVGGAENCFHHGAAIGGVPQDLKYSGARSLVRLGDEPGADEALPHSWCLSIQGGADS